MSANHQFLIFFSFLNAGILVYASAIWFGLARKPKKIERSVCIAWLLFFILELLPSPGLGPPAYWTGPWRALSIANIVAISGCAVFLVFFKGDDDRAVVEQKVHVEWIRSLVVLLLVVGGLFLAFWAYQKTRTRMSEYILFGVLAVAGVIGAGFFRRWRDAADEGLSQKE